MEETRGKKTCVRKNILKEMGKKKGGRKRDTHRDLGGNVGMARMLRSLRTSPILLQMVGRMIGVVTCLTHALGMTLRIHNPSAAHDRKHESLCYVDCRCLPSDSNNEGSSNCLFCG